MIRVALVHYFPFIILLFLSIQSCKRADYVKIEDGRFTYKEAPFFPLMVNYVLEFRQIEGKYRLAPFLAYENEYQFGSETLADLEVECRGHIQIMKDMGFNSIRLCMNRCDVDEKGIFYPTDSAYHEKRLYLHESVDDILAAFGHYVKIAEEMDMKIMWLLRSPADDKRLTPFTIRLIRYFKNQPAIFAYDFINEPLYFETNDNIGKVDLLHMINDWRRMMDLFAPHQFLTLGLAEPLEVFRWDPSIFPIDFIAFHTYNPLRVKNEIYWFNTYAGKPWMLGETGLQADGDSISYEDQVQFNREVARQVIACGGMGLGIWEFQEVVNEDFDGNNLGLINRVGSTTSSDGKYTMIGTIKPAGHDVKNLIDSSAVLSCEPQVNYYNMVGYQNYVLRGRILEETTNKPIEGAVVRGWNYYWDVGQNTFTNEKGEFALYSNAPCRHFRISAPGMSLLIFNAEYDYTPIDSATFNWESVQDTSLEYQQISYRNFLTDSTDIFSFNEDLFNRALLEGDAGNFFLQSVLPQ